MISKRLLATLALACALAGCAVPVSERHPIGSAYAEIHETENKDGSKTCDVKASGGLDVQSLQLNATLCGGKDTFAGVGNGVVGSPAQVQALQSWSAVQAYQQQTGTAWAEKAVQLGGPAACMALALAGVPVPPTLCAAAAAVTPAPVPVAK